MPSLTDLKSRFVAYLKVQSSPEAKAVPAAATHAQRELACRSLCLKCDARTPCSLGRVIG